MFPENWLTSWRPGKPAAACRISAARLFALAFCLAFLPGGCGYGLGGESGSVLGGPQATLKVESVDHGTTYPWLGQIIRTRLRDEVAARNIARWVDSGDAEYSIQIKVKTLTLRTSLYDDDRYALLTSAAIQLEGVIHRAADNAEIWRSGEIIYSDTLDSGGAGIDEQRIADELATQAVRILASEMRHSF